MHHYKRDGSKKYHKNTAGNNVLVDRTLRNHGVFIIAQAFKIYQHMAAYLKSIVGGTIGEKKVKQKHFRANNTRGTATVTTPLNAAEVAALESVPVMPLRCTSVSASEEKIKSDQTSSWQRGSETNSMKRQK